MICAPIDTEAPRFVVLSSSGYPITVGRASGAKQEVLTATVYDRFYMREIASFRSTDRRAAELPRLTGAARSRVCSCGGPKAPHAHLCRKCRRESGSYGDRYLNVEGALAAAAERCAELNAWNEREGWGE